MGCKVGAGDESSKSVLSPLLKVFCAAIESNSRLNSRLAEIEALGVDYFKIAESPPQASIHENHTKNQPC